MYSISDYGKMIENSYRMEAYFNALEQAIRPNSTVLDIGTGTGICAMLACQLGAKKVYAIEPSDVIQVARELAQENGYADQICFIQAFSTGVTLPEAVDVIVSDMRGMLPLFQSHIPSIVDARSRFLATEGIQIPQRDRLWASVVAAPEIYQNYLSFCDEQPYGLTMEAARKRLIQNFYKSKITPEHLIVEPQCWAELDYTAITEPNVQGILNWTIGESRQAHGLCLWFDTTLLDNIGFSNAPGEPNLVYGRAFLPWPTPVDLVAGDQISVKLMAKLINDEYIWVWDTQVLAVGDGNTLKTNFHQSTFFGAILSADHLKQGSLHTPHLNRQGELDYMILGQMQTTQRLEDIAAQLIDKFSDRFGSFTEALSYVGQVSSKYSQ
jgi:type I protein arginine methyltransferase